jgi:hydroxyversicolorone monooxygenase
MESEKVLLCTIYNTDFKVDYTRFMQFSTEVKSAHWQELSSTWLIQLSCRNADGSITDFTDECDVLLHATGVLNNFQWPEIKGIETFKGKLIHTARWLEEYREDEWKQDRVAVIGSGASSIQTVPTMQVGLTR